MSLNWVFCPLCIATKCQRNVVFLSSSSSSLKKRAQDGKSLHCRRDLSPRHYQCTKCDHSAFYRPYFLFLFSTCLQTKHSKVKTLKKRLDDAYTKPNRKTQISISSIDIENMFKLDICCLAILLYSILIKITLFPRSHLMAVEASTLLTSATTIFRLTS